MSAFVKWLEENVRERKWNYSVLAREADLSPAAISQVMSGKYKAGLQFCFGVAQALDEPPEKVLRLAGFLPPKPALDEEAEEIWHYYERMTPAGRRHFRAIARALAEGKLRGDSND